MDTPKLLPSKYTEFSVPWIIFLECFSLDHTQKEPGNDIKIYADNNPKEKKIYRRAACEGQHPQDGFESVSNTL